MTPSDDPSVFPQLEHMLAGASQRLHAARAAEAARVPVPSPAAVDPRHELVTRRRRALDRARRPWTLVAIAATLTTGTALAATQPWQPLLGGERQGHPTATGEPVSADALALLGILRRPQSEDDRGPLVEQALRSIGPQNHGVRVAAVRLLGTAPGGRAIVLVPTARFSDDAASPSGPAILDALCVQYPGVPRPGRPEFADYPCWSASQVAGGKAVGRLRTGGVQRLFGLVPDGVRTAEIELSDGSRLSGDVEANFFDVALPATAPPFARVEALRWRDARGTVVGPPAAP